MHGAQVVLSRAAGALPFPMEAKPADECEKESLQSATCSNCQHVLVTGYLNHNGTAIGKACTATGFAQVSTAASVRMAEGGPQNPANAHALRVLH